MRKQAVRHAGRWIGFVLMAGACGVAHGQEVRTGMVISAGVSAETNPYNLANSDGISVAATAEFLPTLSVQDEKTQVNIQGMAQFRQFLRCYGLEDNYSASTNITSRRSEWLTLRGGAAFSYNRGGFAGYGRPTLGTTVPIGGVPNPTVPPVISIQDPLTSLGDVTILGGRTRVTSIDSSIGADMVLDAYSNASVDLDARTMRFGSSRFDDYNSYNAQVQYSRRLSELFSVGLIGGVGKTNYLDLRQGDATSYNIMASLDRRLGSHWSMSLAMGAAFTDIESRAGRPAAHFTSLTTRGQFCWEGEYSKLCVNGQRSPQPAADGNVRVATSVGADYSLRMSERERLTVGGSYARTGRGRDDLITGPVPAVDFISGYARYDRDINQRLGAFVSGSISKITDQYSSNRANIGVAVGLQYRIGSLQ